jgi:hypothetical protein
MKAMDSNSFAWSEASPGAYRTYKHHMKSFLFYSMHVI